MRFLHLSPLIYPPSSTLILTDHHPKCTEHKLSRQSAQNLSLSKTPPSSEEAKALHEVYLRSISASSHSSNPTPTSTSNYREGEGAITKKVEMEESMEESISIEETKLENTLIMFSSGTEVSCIMMFFVLIFHFSSLTILSCLSSVHQKVFGGMCESRRTG